MNPTISIISMSRRPEMYFDFVRSFEKAVPDIVVEYIVFINDVVLLPRYYSFANEHSKVKVQHAPEDFVFRYGHDTVYNYLEKKAVGNFILKLFDTDICDINHGQLLEDLKRDADIYGMDTYMERGNVTETKFQLYKKGVLEWFGAVHENQHFKIENPKQDHLKGLKVFHHNALDTESSELEKTSDGFIILKRTQIGSDSDKRNMLYETLAWKIVNEGMRHDHIGWFNRHYQINKDVIDWYYQRAKERFHL